MKVSNASIGLELWLLPSTPPPHSSPVTNLLKETFLIWVSAGEVEAFAVDSFLKKKNRLFLKTFKCFHRLKPLKTFPEATSSTRYGRNKQYRLNIRLLRSPTPLTLPLIFWLFYGWRVAHLLPSYHNLRRRTAGETRRQTLGHKRNN